MTSNNVILDKPGADSSASYRLPESGSARLSFSPDEIDGLKLDGQGGLVISFAGGGEVTLSNFQSFVNAGNMLSLKDGTQVNPGSLFNVLEAQKDNPFPSNDTIRIGIPSENSTREISLVPGKKYLFTFDLSEAHGSEVKDGKMVIDFPNGGKIVIPNYNEATSGEQPADLSLASKDCVYTGDELITNIRNLANAVPAETTIVLDEEKEKAPKPVAKHEPKEEESEKATEAEAKKAAEIKPAAGEEATAEKLAAIETAAGGPAAGPAGRANSGYGYNSRPGEDPFVVNPDIGPIDPTALAYRAPFLAPSAVLLVNAAPIGVAIGTQFLDETNLSGGPISANGIISVDFGADGNGGINPNGTFLAEGSLKGGALTSNGVAINITEESGTTYVGTTTGGARVFDLVINQVTGAYVFTQYLPLDHADGSNANDVISLKFGITAKDGDGDSLNAVLTVNIADDAPVISPAGATVDETTLGPATVSGTVVYNFGQDGPATGTLLQTSGVFTPGGSLKSGALTSNGVPVVVTATASGYEGKAGGVTVFTLTLNPSTGAYVFTLLDNLDHADGADPDDVITLSFGVSATDFDGDGTAAPIIISVRDDAPIANDDARSTPESTTITGNVTSNDIPGQDTPVVLTRIVFNGTPTNIPFSGTVTIAGTYGTLTIDKTGAYTYVSKRNANGVDNFTYTLQDGDTDTDTAVLRITVTDVDTIPDIIKPADEIVDETNLRTGVITETGSVTADFFADGPGTFSGNNSFTSGGSRLGGALASGGVSVVVTQTGNTYTGVAGGVTVFTMQINTDGTYVFRLLKPLDHANASNPDDVITLDFGVQATDSDGDSAATTVTVQVKDDGPSITGTAGSVDETNLGASISVSGAVSANFGQDVPGQIQANGSFVPGGSLKGGVLSVDGTPVSVTSTASGYEGKAGGVTVFTLTINPTTGAFTYTQFLDMDHADNTDPNDIITLTFGTKAVDFDGDSASAPIVISVYDDGPTFNPVPVITKPMDVITDETILSSGTITQTGTVVADFFGDTPGSFSANNGFTSGGSRLGGSLTSGGVPVSVTQSGNIYTGVAGGVTIFTMQVLASGAYTFKLFEQLDHANGSDPNDVIVLDFGVRATDSNGDFAETTITVQVKDDAPIVQDDFCTLVGEETQISSNALANDVIGQDVAGRISSVMFGGVTTAVPLSGSTSVASVYGTLTIAANGAYTYRLNGGAHPVTSEEFTVTVVDRDGDTANSLLQVNLVSDSGGETQGSNGNDTINGGPGNNVIFGNGGHDWLYGNGGNDYIEGGNGNDTITGNAGTDVLYGGFGNDIMDGGSENDDLIGEGGADYLTGGLGSDVFWYTSVGEGIDRITDFSLAQNDKLELSNILTGFDLLTDAISDFVFANHVGGNTILSVNPNGTGAEGATQMIVLENITVSVSDLFNSGSIIT